LGYKATGQSAGQAVLNILTTLREVADNAQVILWQQFTARTKHKVSVLIYLSILRCMHLRDSAVSFCVAKRCLQATYPGSLQQGMWQMPVQAA